MDAGFAMAHKPQHGPRSRKARVLARAPEELTRGPLLRLGEGIGKVVYASPHWVVKRERHPSEIMALIFMWRVVRRLQRFLPRRAGAAPAGEAGPAGAAAARAAAGRGAGGAQRHLVRDDFGPAMALVRPQRSARGDAGRRVPGGDGADSPMRALPPDARACEPLAGMAAGGGGDRAGRDDAGRADQRIGAGAALRRDRGVAGAVSGIAPGGMAQRRFLAGSRI